VALSRAGSPESNGHGAERTLVGSLGTVVEQVVAWQPREGYRYRIIAGSPLACHQGQLRLHAVGEQTELHWTIRFRPRLPGTGPLLTMLLESMLASAFRKLKPIVEGG
jgi:hypothetical protein